VILQRRGLRGKRGAAKGQKAGKGGEVLPAKAGLVVTGRAGRRLGPRFWDMGGKDRRAVRGGFWDGLGATICASGMRRREAVTILEVRECRSAKGDAGVVESNFRDSDLWESLDGDAELRLAWLEVGESQRFESELVSRILDHTCESIEGERCTLKHLSYLSYHLNSVRQH
jgi:hypothetical protein